MSFNGPVTGVATHIAGPLLPPLIRPPRGAGRSAVPSFCLQRINRLWALNDVVTSYDDKYYDVAYYDVATCLGAYEPTLRCNLNTGATALF